MLDALFAPVPMQVAGSLLVFLALGRLVLSWSHALRRIRHERAVESALRDRFHWRVESEKLAFYKRKDQAELGWDGYRKFVIRRIARNEDRAGQIASFYLHPHDGKPLPSFHPGQFLTFRLRVEGQPKEVVRCYSLSDKPHRDHFRVSVKRVPGGIASNHFHDALREGDIVDVRSPGGRFYLDMTENWPVVLIAGGVGITPVLSMYNAIASEQPLREVWFFYAARTGDEFIMREHMAQLAGYCAKARIHYFYSQPGPEDDAVIAASVPAGARILHRKGRVSGETIEGILPPGAQETHHFYMCGPPPMMDAITRDLKEWGVPEAQVHLEAFGASGVKAVKKPPAETATAAPALEIGFSRSGKVLPWDASCGSLLEFAEKNGVSIEAGCCAGDCHTCATAVKAGDIEYLRKLAQEPEKGTCLPCVAIPVTNVILDA